jgi:hypothetical protein
MQWPDDVRLQRRYCSPQDLELLVSIVNDHCTHMIDELKFPLTVLFCNAVAR